MIDLGLESGSLVKFNTCRPSVLVWMDKHHLTRSYGVGRISNSYCFGNEHSAQSFTSDTLVANF